MNLLRIYSEIMQINCYRLGLMLLALVMMSCGYRTKKNSMPNIVWIVSEDNSKHYLKLFDEKGTNTPHIEKLASHGITYERAFSNGAVCSVARSAIISGCYGPRTLTNYHRSHEKAPLPAALKMFPAYMRRAGYYTANNAKEDYNFIKDQDAWDESSKKASWRNRAQGQPFFYVHNLGITHESGLHASQEEMMEVLDTGFNASDQQVLPFHPNTELFRCTNAYYRQQIRQMDLQVGEVVQSLQDDGLLNDTFIFYYGDHGGVLPGSKGYINETGVHVPLVVYVPDNYRYLVGNALGSSAQQFVSFVDLGPTVLNLAGIEIPELMDGVPFLGTGCSTVANAITQQTAFSYADRFDEKYDMVRAVRQGRFKYVRNFQPFNPDALWNNYRYKQEAYQEWNYLYKRDELSHAQRAFFKPKPVEQLFDLDNDPYELNNLASDGQFHGLLESMREQLNAWQDNMPDLSFYPEFYLLKNAINDPVGFGQLHQSDIQRYKYIANLSLEDFSVVKDKITQALGSGDPWDRYWALITCSSFGKTALSLKHTISEIAHADSQAVNRVRAAEYLALTQQNDPVKIMTTSLYRVDDPMEALLILNSIALVSAHPHDYRMRIDQTKLNKVVLDDKLVQWRLAYLTELNK